MFGIAYIFSIGMIFKDISKREEMYDDDIDEDLKTMKELGLDSKMAEFEAELAVRLAGGKTEDGADDEFIESAKALTKEQYSKYL